MLYQRLRRTIKIIPSPAKSMERFIYWMESRLAKKSYALSSALFLAWVAPGFVHELSLGRKCSWFAPFGNG
jgi:hypothetical protein